MKILTGENKLMVSELIKAKKKDNRDKPNKPLHEINAFFEGIAETVKTFPKKVQVQLKRDVFNMVNDAEASLLNNDNANSTNLLYYTLDSPMVGGADYLENRIMASTSASGSNEYTANLLQTTDDTSEKNCEIQIKEETEIM